MGPRKTTKRSNDGVPITTMSTDLIFEILIRLPDCRSALRCAAVCKEWLSLVSDPTFRPRFTEHHNQLLRNINEGQLPSEILFRTNIYMYGRTPRPPLSLDYFSQPNRCSEEDTSSYLSFLPGWPSVTVRSSSGDLLLVELLVELRGYSNENRRLCVCNPLTKRWITLPDPPPAPLRRPYHYGFTTQATSSSLLLKFRVVVMSSVFYVTPGVKLAVFRSETGRWDQSYRSFRIEYLYKHQRSVLSFHVWRITTIGRLMYLPAICSYKNDIRNLAVIDTFSESFSFRLMELPQAGFGLGTWWCSYDRVLVGAVRGRLRVCQYHQYKKRDSLVVKIWELKEYDYNNNVASWVLVKKAKLENLKAKFKWLRVWAFHPQDDDVLFVVDVRLKDIVWKYQISRGSTEMLGVVKGVCMIDNFHVHALVHPPWPTLIPSSSSSGGKL